MVGRRQAPRRASCEASLRFTFRKLLERPLRSIPDSHIPDLLLSKPPLYLLAHEDLIVSAANPVGVARPVRASGLRKQAEVPSAGGPPVCLSARDGRVGYKAIERMASCAR